MHDAAKTLPKMRSAQTPYGIWAIMKKLAIVQFQ